MYLGLDVEGSWSSSHRMLPEEINQFRGFHFPSTMDIPSVPLDLPFVIVSGCVDFQEYAMIEESILMLQRFQPWWCGDSPTKNKWITLKERSTCFWKSEHFGKVGSDFFKETYPDDDRPKVLGWKLECWCKSFISYLCSLVFHIDFKIS